MSTDMQSAITSELDRATELERELLGCLLASETAIDDTAELLTVEDFAVFAHARVFSTCLDLREANAPVTAATVYERMAAAGTAKELGPSPKMWFAERIDEGKFAPNARYLAGRVKEVAARRRLRHAANEIMAVALSEPDRPAADATAACEEILFGLGAGRDASSGPRQSPELVRRALARIDDLASGIVNRGLPTGFAELDGLLGGLKPGNIIVIGARPGVGKTSLAVAIALNAVAAGVGSLLFSLEMADTELMERILAMRSGVSLRTIQSGKLTGEQSDRVSEAGDTLRQQPLEIDDNASLTVARSAATVRRAVRRRGIGLVVVDYIQLIPAENSRLPREQQVSTASRQLKLLARACNVPIIVLCQLNRACEDRADGKPRLSDLRESGGIEQDADVVILLSFQKDQNKDAPVWLTDVQVAKQRGGPTGEITLAYRRGLTRYENAPK